MNREEKGAELRKELAELENAISWQHKYEGAAYLLGLETSGRDVRTALTELRGRIERHRVRVNQLLGELEQ